MKLKKIQIRNYRSIKSLELDVGAVGGRNCQILFGVNETGKSNILKAIRLIDKTANIKYDNDCTKQSMQLSEPVEVRYLFEIDNDKLRKKLLELGFSKVLPESIQSMGSITKQISFNKKSQRTDAYLFEVSEDTHYSKLYLDQNNNLLFSEEQPANCKRVTAEILNEFLGTKLAAFFDSQLPGVIFWEPSDAYLINQPIQLNNFKDNPKVCIPLRNIFYLLGLDGDNLKSTIDRALNSVQDREELEEKLSEAATQHINELWPEHCVKISVRIEKDGLCEVSVADKDCSKEKFRMEQRSDGFKQFISILLNLSVEDRTERLKNKIILLDEPERSLHPGSTRYLRDELINISKNNVVLVASHSIFMVDRRKLDRHLTVRKINNLTSVKRVNPENPLEEEVIYEALGTSIYELIEPYIIIFEGPIDKSIFDAFTGKFKEGIRPDRLKSISATGVKEIRKYVKFFNQKTVTGVVLVDSDNDGRTEKRYILNEHPEFKGTTFELKDLIDIKKDEITLEDLLPTELILEEAQKFYKQSFSNPGSEPILLHLKKIKGQSNIKEDLDLSEFKRVIKERVFRDIGTLNVAELEKKYSAYLSFLKNLHEKIKKIQTMGGAPHSPEIRVKGS